MKPFILIDDFPEIHEKPFIPKVWEGNLEIAPKGFNTAIIHLDGRADALLNWKEARLQAVHAIAKGLKLLWEIDLGLFDRLYAPLSDQTQFLTLNLSLEHFRDSLWQEFREHTIGLTLYRGSLDFAVSLRHEHFETWLKEQPGYQGISQKYQHQLFCHDVATEYLTLLARRLPDGLPPFVFLDIAEIEKEILPLLLSRRRFEGIYRFITKGSLPAESFRVFVEHEGFSTASKVPENPINEIALGICLPTEQISPEILKQLFSSLHTDRFRFVDEKNLTVEWQGLEQLIVFSDKITSEGIRKLRGFCAAGGTIITFGSLLHLPTEIAFDSAFSYDRAK